MLTRFKHTRFLPANKKGTFVYQKFLFCLSKPQAWHIIECITRLRRDIHSYITKGGNTAFASHHAPACIFLRADDIPQQVADDIQGYALIYWQKCGIINLSINKNLTKEMCNEQQRHYKIFLRSGCLRKPA